MNELSDRILQFIQKQRGGVTFAELLTIPGVKGDYVMVIRPNLSIWYGLSSDAIDAIWQLVNSDKLRMVTASFLSYLIDGAVPVAPRAKHCKPYASEHWYPVAFWLPNEIDAWKRKPKIIDVGMTI